jgi:hypothetical protein
MNERQYRECEEVLVEGYPKYLRWTYQCKDCNQVHLHHDYVSDSHDVADAYVDRIYQCGRYWKKLYRLSEFNEAIKYEESLTDFDTTNC